MGFTIFEQFLVVLCGAIVATTLFRRLKQPPLLAYLFIGLLVGPYSFGLIQDVHSIELLSELGVVFLLFMLGLEFSFGRMVSMGKTVFGLGSAQVLITSLMLIGLSLAAGLPLASALVLAGALSLSSTAVVSRELIRRNQLDTPHGELSIGTLIFQDLAAVVFLILVPALGSTDAQMNGAALTLKLLEGSLLLVVLLVVGRIVMPLLLHESARSASSDVFVLTSLAAALLAAWITHAAGLSMALGGFLAGMMLGESHYRYQLEADIRPFRDLLLGLFFVSVGMQLDLSSLQQHWYWVLILTAGLIISKTLLISILGRLLKMDPVSSLKAGLCLSQGGEFGFALLALALGNQVIDPQLNALATGVIVLSMMLTPILMNHTDRLAYWLHPKTMTEVREEFSVNNLHQAGEGLSSHVIICGFGRVGQVITRFLGPLNIPYIVIDNDPLRVSEASTAGEKVCYGDAQRADIIAAVGGDRARMLILTFPEHDISLHALKHLRPRFPELPILVRTRDDSPLDLFQRQGATEVIPEALEGSLMLVSHILSILGVPPDRIARQIDQVRSERYQLLHGFYHGGHSQKTDDEGQMKEVLHPVPISSLSYACNKTLADMNLGVLEVSVAMIRRHDDLSEHAPTESTQLCEGDIVILQGPADAIEAAEDRLLSG
ncbi:cation:proton antiporter [Neptuniibacter sp. CAU 1671]|uniref:cation:proton antiporter domain-containing protein n=1 Tax=Neptuniibacter sp. CAU 1671 TaxID=3032593 RepID=UPI0023DB08F6|nr:cation:proton antiporter [Neptuniibacter sp. CAU 1671]MDF2180902.1 cation:proton antiporter [Neptuniibacter sp. CAU 1671]